MRNFICLTSFCMMLALSGPLPPSAHAETFAVVDTAKILSESAPAKAGEAHLQKVQAVLQKGMDDLQKIHKGKESTPTAQRALREGYQALELQLAKERQAVLQVLGDALEKSVKTWRSKNKKYLAVITKQTLLDSDASADVTPAIMQEMNKQAVTFADLPTVQVQAPAQPAPKAGTPAKQNKN